MSKLIGLLDCNNFYASCERVFNPGLRRKPVVVLSNNDGCVVARSNEVKQLGIPMGAPIFQIQPLVQQHQIKVYSSNYALYGDLSQRVMQTLAQFTPEVEVYSIDEAFLNLSISNHSDLTHHIQQIKATVNQWTGIPISIGVAPTKTLAKIANRVAKKHPEANGIFTLNDPNTQQEVLSQIEVGDIWGIGRQWSKRLNHQGIETALQLRDANEHLIRQQMGVVGERIVLELRGLSCLPLELCPQTAKSRMVSRSFGQPIECLVELKEAIATYTTRAALKLRQDDLATNLMTVFLSTNRFKPNEPQHNPSMGLELPVATNDTAELIHYALKLTERLYQQGYRYQKAGVLLSGLVPAHQTQGNLFDDPTKRERSQRLMSAIDQINQRFGSDTLQFAAAGLKKPWAMRAAMRSPRFSTRWDELLEVS